MCVLMNAVQGKLSVQQYMRGKPSPWGIKILVLASECGIIYDFILYQGSSTELDQSIWICNFSSFIFSANFERKNAFFIL